MYPQALDQHLHALTNSERAYKAKRTPPFFSRLPQIDYHGQKVFTMKFCDSEMIQQLQSKKNRLLFIKKQSRYQACPLHIHDWIEINYMYSGTCPQAVKNTNYILTKGQVTLIDTDTPHATAELSTDDIMVSIVINKKYLNNNFFNRLSCDSILSTFFINAINKNTNHDNFIIFHSENSRRLPLFFNELLCEFYDPSVNSSDIINNLFTLILYELITIYEKDLETHSTDLTQNSITAILRFITENYQTCTLASTAQHFNMNPNYLTTLLKQYTGYSYKQVLQQERLNFAAHLLRNTNLSVTEIIHKAGYENISFFYEKFTDTFHCSPKNYRTL